MAEESAAERRRRRLLEKGDERMARVMGTYGKNAGAGHRRCRIAFVLLHPCLGKGGSRSCVGDKAEASSLLRRAVSGTSSAS